jgi:predicted TIM-barrel fold metal-dependent hydrolase
MFKVNDIHVHLGHSNGINNYFLPDQIQNFMKKNNLENIVLMPFELETNTYNQKIIQLSKEHESIYGYYWIQKSQLKEDFKILSTVLNDKLVGVKFHGSYEKLPISNNIYEPILELLNERESKLIIHCGRYKDGHIDSNTSYLHGLKIAKKFPKITVILAHMGGNDTTVVKRAVDESKSLQNVYFETSGISTPLRVEYAVEKLGPKRILFGSDFPWCSFKGIYYGVEDALIDDSAKELIFNKNFNSLFKI